MSHEENYVNAVKRVYPEANPPKELVNPDDEAFRGPSNDWEALTRLYETHVKMFIGYDQMMGMLLNEEVQANLQDIVATTNLAKGISADVIMLKNKTTRIYKKHANKVGYAKDMDDNFEIIKIFQEYAELTDQHQLLVVPMLLQVNEHLNYALTKIQAAQQAGELANNPA